MVCAAFVGHNLGKNVKRVIVIDDDKAVGGAIKLWLELESADVTYVDDSLDGIETIKTAVFDLAIIDIFMPGMNGLEAIKAVHALKPNLPIIAMSGLGHRADSGAAPGIAELATRSGAAEAIRKPFRPRDLMQAIESCLGGPLREARASRTEPTC